MNKNSTLTIAQIILIVLGIAMIYIGAIFAPKLMLPPIITGVGFFVIAWAFSAIKK
ncbi:MAG: hypothetical protein QM478_11145 [Flavobacteriaceae bacterium]